MYEDALRNLKKYWGIGITPLSFGPDMGCHGFVRRNKHRNQIGF